MRNENRLRRLSTHVRAMSEQQLIEAMFMNPYGLQNRKAYDEFDGVTDYVALIDVDSLKWVNDHMGHAAGDALIERMSKALLNEFDSDAYHLSGDEFAVVSDNRFDLAKRLRLLQDALSFGSVQSIAPAGLGFSYGIARSLEMADKKMQQNKTLRTRRGERAVRGATPPTIRAGEPNAVYKARSNNNG